MQQPVKVKSTAPSGRVSDAGNVTFWKEPVAALGVIEPGFNKNAVVVSTVAVDAVDAPKANDPETYGAA